MKIITATAKDVSIIRAIAQECWPMAYRGIISEEQIIYMLEEMYSEASLVQQMNEGCEFLLCETNNQITGFASYSLLENGNSKLHKLYLLSSEKGKGHGKLLLEEVMHRAKTRGAKKIELQVNKQNPSKEFYRLMGFEIKEELVLNIGNGFVMDDYVLTKILI